jgi:hypothetical protein
VPKVPKVLVRLKTARDTFLELKGMEKAKIETTRV